MTYTIQLENEPANFFDAFKKFALQWQGAKIERQPLPSVAQAISDTARHENLTGPFDTPDDAIAFALAEKD